MTSTLGLPFSPISEGLSLAIRSAQLNAMDLVCSGAFAPSHTVTEAVSYVTKCDQILTFVTRYWQYQMNTYDTN